jgi:hypothetical protein
MPANDDAVSQKGNTVLREWQTGLHPKSNSAQYVLRVPIDLGNEPVRG